jgi:hypothetical protein
LARGGYRGLVSCELAGKRIDFRLALGGSRGEIGTIARKEDGRFRRPATAISGPAPPERKDEARHFANDLALDHVELVPRLPAGLFHAAQLGLTIGRGDHGLVLPAHVTKLDGPSYATCRASSMTKSNRLT